MLRLANARVVPTKHKVRILGVTIDRNCTFSCHVNDICKKAFHSINYYNRLYLRKYLPGDALKHLTNSLVLSRIDYCIITPSLRDLHWLPVEPRVQLR